MKRAIPVLSMIVVVSAMSFQALTPDPTLAEEAGTRLPEIEGYASRPVQASEAERTVLPADTRIEKRLYANARGETHQVSLIVGGRSKSSIHRPELCMPAQGYQMSEPGTVTADGVEWRVLRLERGSSVVGLAYTFFNQEGFRTSSHVMRILRDAWDRTVYNRLDRWAMVSVHSSVSDREALTPFLRELKGALK